ncbi:U32 family peptidase [Ferrimonas gelatinilytica]
MRLSLAPNWWPMDRQAQQSWLAQAQASPAERIVLGETVCRLRDRMAPRTLLEHAQALKAAGKEVVLASLNMVASEADLALVRGVCRQNEFPLEAHDMAGVALAHQHGLPFIAGAGLNIYNLDGIRWLLSLGMVGYQPPMEMAADTLATLMAQCQAAQLRDRFSLEILGYGRPVLAVSARCSSARVAGRNRQRCNKVCQQQGALPVETLEQQPLLTLNGVQVHGHRPQDLLGELALLRALGVEWLRVDPGPQGAQPWLKDLQRALAQQEDAFTPPEPGIRHFWQRPEGDFALHGD